MAENQAVRVEADRLAAVYALEAAEERERQAAGKQQAAELKAKQDAIDAAKQAEADKAAAVQAEIDRQAEHDRVIAAETAKREANNRHVGAVRKAAKEALMEFDDVSEDTAKCIVMAITNGLIPAVKISY